MGKEEKEIRNESSETPVEIRKTKKGGGGRLVRRRGRFRHYTASAKNYDSLERGNGELSA